MEPHYPITQKPDRQQLFQALEYIKIPELSGTMLLFIKCMRVLCGMWIMVEDQFFHVLQSTDEKLDASE